VVDKKVEVSIADEVQTKPAEVQPAPAVDEQPAPQEVEPVVREGSMAPVAVTIRREPDVAAKVVERPQRYE
jgi:hypothetical protein